MKQILVYILITFLLHSCSSDKYKTELLGNWYFYDTPESSKHLNEFKIYSDSVIINSIMGKTVAKWKATEQKIQLYDIEGYPSENELNYDYKLKSTDLLDLKVYGDTVIDFKNVIKAKNAIDFLQKNKKLKFDLPKTQVDLIMIGNSRFNFIIYAGYDNEKLRFMTDNSENLNNLDNEISDFKENLGVRPFSKARFLLIADKNIPESKLDSLKTILNQTSIKKNFRAYTNDKIKYNDNLIWYGLED